LDEEGEFTGNWPYWRSFFPSTRSQIKKGLFVDFVKINVPAILFGTLIGILSYFNSWRLRKKPFPMFT